MGRGCEEASRAVGPSDGSCSAVPAQKQRANPCDLLALLTTRCFASPPESSSDGGRALQGQAPAHRWNHISRPCECRGKGKGGRQNVTNLRPASHLLQHPISCTNPATRWLYQPKNSWSAATAPLPLQRAAPGLSAAEAGTQGPVLTAQQQHRRRGSEPACCTAQPSFS